MGFLDILHVLACFQGSRTFTLGWDQFDLSSGCVGLIYYLLAGERWICKRVLEAELRLYEGVRLVDLSYFAAVVKGGVL